MFDDPVIVKTAFPCQLTDLCSHSAIQSNQMSAIFAKFGKLTIKMWFPFNFAKRSKDRDFVVGGSKNWKLLPNTCFGVTFQKNVLPTFLLSSSVCY